ncbi:plasmid replication protein [Salmonella enterica]|nr:plasmid replication protein [Salmonella enterica]MDV5358272.1 plasmid replication protein [Enterobacter asburiae]
MTALHQGKRVYTAKEMGKIMNRSERTARKFMALPRTEYEKEAKQRRLKAFVLRESGLKWADVAEKLGTTVNGAVALYKRYEKLDLNENRG